MNLYIKNVVKSFTSLSFSMIVLLGINSCATYGVQQGKNISEIKKPKTNPSDVQIFLIGDAGNADEPQSQQTLAFLQNKLEEANDNSVLLFLGDNIYPSGMPKETDQNYSLAKEKLENQFKITKNFKGKTIVIPGNHDWYHGMDGLKAQEDFVQNYFHDKKAYLPKNNCPIDDISINKKTKLIVINSEWALVDWDQYPDINKNCSIKTQKDFYTEFKDLINKNQDKQIIVAIHHPLVSSGTHAGFTSAKSHLYPLKTKFPVPGIASLINILRTSSGVSMEDNSNKHYTKFASRIKNIIQDKENVIVVSGHDHNLQYHELGNIRQIISGAGSKSDPSTITRKTDFSFGGSGFAVLNLRKNGSSDVEFFSTKDNKLKKLTQIQIRKEQNKFVNNYPSVLPKEFSSSIYTEKSTQKSGIYRWLFGDHYRKYYGIPINAAVADLSTLNGGFTPFREGGGNQSNSLRLLAKDDQEFVMRGIKKNAVRFLNNQAFNNKMFLKELENTFPERFIMDFYTTNHPFTPFAVGNMADKVGIFHSNQKLYYIPKQKTLQQYNDKFGDEMYMIEERFSSDPKTLQMLDNADDIVSTEDVIKKLQTNEKFSVDKESYIRARIFDMLIGDWDRHSDQWKWAAYKNGDKTVYKPIPKDRDQAFSKYDGVVFFFAMTTPAIRHMKTFKDDLKNVKWFNREAYPLDLIFAKNTSLEDWEQQADFIQKNLTNEAIEEAFKNLPKEVQDETIVDIQSKLKSRRDKLKTYSQQYYQVLQEKVPIAGTTSKDKFVITKKDNSVEIQQYVLTPENEEKLVYQKNYDENSTKELWIYGLENDDIYEVKGNGKSKINIRLIGGYNHDVYNVENGKNVKIYDFKDKKNTYNIDSRTTKRITSDYHANSYDSHHPKYNFFAAFPNANYNPDEGVILGFVASYTVNNFLQNKFTQKHILKGNIFTETSGFNLEYSGIFKKAILGWDLGLDTYYTSPYYTQNFFGFSNESVFDKHRNDDEKYARGYNRVRITQINFSPSIQKTGWLNFTHKFQFNAENVKVEKNEDRFVTVSQDIQPNVFKNQQFGGADYSFSFKNYDNKSFPTLGLSFVLNAGWKTNLSNFDRNFLSLNGTLDITHRIDKNGKFVFANSLNTKWINNENFDFFQAASIGGKNGLRAYRNERFSGNSFLVNSSEIRWNIGRPKNNFVPTNLGLLVGYDVGRVWKNGENSRKWHQSVGAGFWVNVLETISARFNYFIGEDGGRISGGLGMNF